MKCISERNTLAITFSRYFIFDFWFYLECFNPDNIVSEWIYSVTKFWLIDLQHLPWNWQFALMLCTTPLWFYLELQVWWNLLIWKDWNMFSKALLAYDVHALILRAHFLSKLNQHRFQHRNKVCQEKLFHIQPIIKRGIFKIGK